MGRMDVEQAQQLLWDDLMALHREAQHIGRRAPGADPRATYADRFMRVITRGREDGRLVGAIDRLMRESAYGAVLDDPHRPDVLLEQRIVLAPRPYSFLWTQGMLDTAHRRVRRLGSR